MLAVVDWRGGSRRNLNFDALRGHGGLFAGECFRGFGLVSFPALVLVVVHVQVLVVCSQGIVELSFLRGGGHCVVCSSSIVFASFSLGLSLLVIFFAIGGSSRKQLLVLVAQEVGVPMGLGADLVAAERAEELAGVGVGGEGVGDAAGGSLLAEEGADVGHGGVSVGCFGRMFRLRSR